MQREWKYPNSLVCLKKAFRLRDKRGFTGNKKKLDSSFSHNHWPWKFFCVLILHKFSSVIFFLWQFKNRCATENPHRIKKFWALLISSVEERKRDFRANFYVTVFNVLLTQLILEIAMNGDEISLANKQDGKAWIE